MNKLDDYELAVASGLYLEREAYAELLAWKKERARDHVAYFLKGPRRVGKSVLALELARKEYRSFIKISFDKASEEVKTFSSITWNSWMNSMIASWRPMKPFSTLKNR